MTSDEDSVNKEVTTGLSCQLRCCAFFTDN